MRSWRIVVGLAVLARCGEAAFSPTNAPGVVRGSSHGEAALPAPPIEAVRAAATEFPTPPPTVRYLDHPERLSRFFSALANLDSGEARDDVRIVQFGDSHTAADLGTGAFRRALQARFGDGGRGFVSLGQPWKGYRQDGIDGGMSREFAPVRVGLHHGNVVGVGGAYGLLGIAIATDRGGARAWTAVRAPTSRIELATWDQPHGGSFDVFVDGVRQLRVATRGAPGGSRFTSLDVADGLHDIEVRTLGDGDVRILGMALDRAEIGIVVDALGINGAQVGTPLNWGEEHFAEQLRHRAPALVVVAYGTNESMDSTLEDEDFERRLVEVLGRVARATPAASCVILGPPDRGERASADDGGVAKGEGTWQSAPRIGEIADLERRVADAAGCAYFDEIAAMGGAGAIIRWATEVEPRAGSDRVHLTRSGYAELGRAFAEDAISAYEAWRQREGFGPVKRPEAVGLGSLSGVRP
ncbi:MAG: GDSL-type esterase/lipase family protein [Polyangiaceae bacterium]